MPDLLTFEQMNKMTTPRLLEWVRRILTARRLYNEDDEEYTMLQEQLLLAKQILDERANAKSNASA